MSGLTEIFCSTCMLLCQLQLSFNSSKFGFKSGQTAFNECRAGIVTVPIKVYVLDSGLVHTMIQSNAASSRSNAKIVQKSNCLGFCEVQTS